MPTLGARSGSRGVILVSRLTGLTINKRKAMIPAHGSASKIDVMEVACHDHSLIETPSGDIFLLQCTVGAPQSRPLQ